MSSVVALIQLKKFKSSFDEVLLKYIRKKKDEAREIDERYCVFIDCLEDFIVRGGKRVRPAFMYFAYLSVGGRKKMKAMLASRTPELLQSFLLIHDDIIDRSTLRRGRSTVHKLMESEYNRLGLVGDKEHFGISTAIIIGDLAHMFSYDALMSSGFELSLLNETRKKFDQITFQTAAGWYRELISTMGLESSEEELLKTIGYVSAVYTIAGPVQMGAILAGASEKQIQRLTSYGMKLGVAFQIRDDILGMFGDEAELGKPVNSDMKEGKKTLLVSRLRAKLSENDRKIFSSVYGRSGQEEDLKWVRNKMVESGALKEAENESLRLVREAITELADFAENEGTDFMRGIAEYMVERKV